ncbi:MAG TPA: DUF5615 family PIN-like protein, partial [Thermoguttaceae bacterium]|nr:DUF5615 family PIN-like protein [Thermoguttaceae bacterium]
VTATQMGLSQASDEELLRTAQAQGRIFVTRDRDFGHLVFVKGIRVGVFYLRMLPSTQEAVHRQLDRILNSYSEEEINGSFFVVSAQGYRKRKIHP